MYREIIHATLLSKAKNRRQERHTIGVILRFFQLLPTLTVIENVRLPMDFCRVWKRSERRERAEDEIDRGRVQR